MLKTPYRTAFAVLALICTTACHRVSPAEERIIGTWEFTGIDTTGRVVFRRDHTVVELFQDWKDLDGRWYPALFGTWRLEADEVVIDDQPLTLSGYPPLPRRITREPLPEYHADRWVREGHSDFNRISTGDTLYSQASALLYVTASLIAFSASVYAIRKSSFKREFVFLAVAAVVAFAYCVLLLVAELAQTGEVLLSFTSLRSLQLPREILKVASIVIYTIGFTRLAYATGIRRSTNDRI